jgi:hypothetical protein
MLVRFIKNSPSDPTDILTCVFPDGTSTSMPMGRQGILPHEAFHFVVEKTLGWRDAFFGQVAHGARLPEMTAKLHDTEIDRAKNTQAIQSEALVECLQTETWGGAVDPADFALNLLTNCRRRGVPPPDVNAEEIATVRTALRELGAAWRPLTAYSALERTF